MKLFAGKNTAGRAGVEQRRQGRRCVDHDHLPARPSPRSRTSAAALTPRSGREPSRSGLSALRDASASSLTATTSTLSLIHIFFMN